MFAGQTIDGAGVALTLTVNEQVAELPTAVQVTVVVPFGNVEPEGGLQTAVPAPEQLPLTTGAEYVTIAEHCPGAAGTLIFAGHVIVGVCVSLTVTVNEQLAELLTASLTVQVTVVAPFGNVEPER